MNIKSFVYQELSDTEIRHVMTGVFPDETVLSANLLGGGLFNTTYRVITENHDVVLRMGPVHRELLLPYELNLMTAEAETIRLCHEHGIPASRIVHLDTSKTRIDRDFMVVERIDSVPLNDASISEEVRRRIHYDCGVMMRKMHEISGEKFGRLADNTAGRGYDSWYKAIYNEFVKIFHTARPYNIFTAGLEEKAFAFLAERKFILDRITVPRLTHCDLWDGNILAGKQDGNYELRAIIDGDRAIFGDVDLDISRVWRHNEAFLAGYGSGETEFTADEVQQKRDVYSVMLNLNDAYVWIAEYDNPQAYENTRNDAMKTLGMI